MLPTPPAKSGFVTIPLELRNHYGLATLACIITSTPGTVWVSFDSAKGLLLIHVLDLVEEATWIQLIKTPLRTSSHGDFRMSAQTFLMWSLSIAELLFVLAMAFAVLRMLRGPSAQNRVLALDAFYVAGMGLILTFGIQTGDTVTSRPRW